MTSVRAAARAFIARADHDTATAGRTRGEQRLLGRIDHGLGVTSGNVERADSGQHIDMHRCGGIAERLGGNAFAQVVDQGLQRRRCAIRIEQQEAMLATSGQHVVGTDAGSEVSGQGFEQALHRATGKLAGKLARIGQFQVDEAAGTGCRVFHGQHFGEATTELGRVVQALDCLARRFLATATIDHARALDPTLHRRNQMSRSDGFGQEIIAADAQCGKVLFRVAFSGKENDRR